MDEMDICAGWLRMSPWVRMARRVAAPPAAASRQKMAKAPVIQPIKRGQALGQLLNKAGVPWPQCTGQLPYRPLYRFLTTRCMPPLALPRHLPCLLALRAVDLRRAVLDR